jgi:hypothetical protein
MRLILSVKYTVIRSIAHGIQFIGLMIFCVDGPKFLNQIQDVYLKFKILKTLS